jgi:hypothetical protein
MSRFEMPYMRLLYFSFLAFAALAVSCKKTQVQESVWVNAIVEDTSDMNCGFPRLNFSEDSIKVKAFTGEKHHLSFVSKGLPVELNTQGEKVRVLIKNLKPEESILCLTWGPNYPAIKIVSAKKR